MANMERFGKLQCVGDMIPPELYEVVADVLVFIDEMDQLKRKLDLNE